jgi:carboxylesterase type B
LPFPNDREDEFECLNLLIVRPSKAALARHGLDAEALKLPVLVYIHGGGFADGSATSPVHGKYLASQITLTYPIE